MEQGIFAVPKAPGDPVTKVLQCVKVQGRNAPRCVFFGYIPPSSAISAREIAEVIFV
jgi:hypothetical protein